MQHKSKITNDFTRQFVSMGYAIQQSHEISKLLNLFAGLPEGGTLV